MKNVTGHRAFVLMVVALTAVVAVVGLFVAGSPGERREARLDQQRVNDLQNIASAVDGRYARTASLPDSLDALITSDREPYYVPSIQDPATGEPYAYEVTGGSTYTLCATFEQASESMREDKALRPMPVAPPRAAYIDRRWEHPAGRHCFDLDAKDSVPRQACGLTNPCQAGSTCAKLPGEEGPVCVPQGAECEAAGCASGCMIMESYPVQVRCDDAAEPRDHEASDCRLMRHAETGEVDCFGCANGICNEPTADHEPYSRPQGEIGIPYACYGDESGCQLAQ